MPILQLVKSKVQEIAPLNATFRIELLDQIIFIDGTQDKNVVSDEDNEAQCTIKTTEEVLQSLGNGELNPMAAAMSGQIIIQGEMGLAMKLQSILSQA